MKPVEKMNKEELIHEVYRLAGWTERLEKALERIRDMTEKAGANEHARYCFEIANELLARRDEDGTAVREPERVGAAGEPRGA